MTNRNLDGATAGQVLRPKFGKGRVQAVSALLSLLQESAGLLPERLMPASGTGSRVDDRRVISGILHVLKTECRRRDVPAACGPPTTVCNRDRRRSQRRIWRRTFEKLAASGPVPGELSLDSGHVTGRRSAQGSKRGVGAGDRHIARRRNEQGPCLGR
jgi:transposase